MNKYSLEDSEFVTRLVSPISKKIRETSLVRNIYLPNCTCSLFRSGLVALIFFEDSVLGDDDDDVFFARSCLLLLLLLLLQRTNERNQPTEKLKETNNKQALTVFLQSSPSPLGSATSTLE